MSIQTATDLILDVVKAADPAVARRAESMLEMASTRKSAQDAATPAFQRQLLASAEPMAVMVSQEEADAAVGKNAQSYERFEAMVLQNFIGSMLPSDSEELYGKGTAGEIWKSMMAEQLGAVLAKGGGIGIAARMLADRFTPGLTPESADGVASNVSNRATSLVNEVQKDIFADISATGEPADTPQDSGRRA
ncbi:rod-binding protein [Hoeflea ulvae]|uniref:Rod-binding protein n=1 Tax=Hoeflea ulvae TaxID=2983764 RepID=A0ABT3YCR1_9HYPH|nr:rod-binding protein [Hoeflea ulvae]MCY0093540.1 rod-binding protein [Hoeflea ulvae]